MKLKCIKLSLVALFLPFGLNLKCLGASNQALAFQVEQVFKSVDTPRPIQITATPDKSGRLFLVLQEGKVHLLGNEKGNSSSDVILDLTGLDLIDNAFEEGLLGLAFHPECAKNNLFYIYHTLQNPKRSVLVERKFSDLKSFSVDQKYQREILSILQPYWNHNSGIPVFGPDGFLYLSTGDGGSANDPHNHSQNTFSLLGKVLRIDVDSQVGSLPYKIPADNPFVGKPGYRGEIWAYGLRNPWLLHWDMRQERLFCADVGQHLREEVNLITKGGNYGWNIREGSQPFPASPFSTKTIESIPPVFEYGHDQGTSISGGCVYYGKKFPELNGMYLFGDWGTGKTWALNILQNDKIEVRDISFRIGDEVLNPPPVFQKGKPKSPFKPVNFCMGSDGDLYILDWQGMIYRIG
ncbi:MAG: PQQ-dependent sugar dehydrogenase [Verrucomicrobiota bacterium]|nr:PQQ-dependent sugar dehydrogenase [Verrucomicrobiota bacterium]